MTKKKTLICIHVMPSEIEMFERLMQQMKRALMYLDENDDVTLKVTLNLNPELTDWENSELKNGHFIVFEILGHSSDKYKEGKKFKISNLQKGSFEVNFKIDIDKRHKFRWCLTKDDVTPQDIFRLTNEGPTSKAIVAKYCIQDCNLVHYLFNKVDVLTDLIEMSKLCSVPMSFLIYRGQGIKLTSYVAKKCREKGVLIFSGKVSASSPLDTYKPAVVLATKNALSACNGKSF